MTTRGTRLAYIDLLRGVAVLFMIVWHVVDAWTIREARDPTAFGVIAFFAGWAAPLFLFLAGVAIPLAGTARMSRGLDRRAAAWTLQKRGWQVFILAHLFRFQSFLLNPNGSWNAILKPDILNILGLGIVAAACVWGRARSSRAIAAAFAASALLVLALTPLAPGWWWPTLLHPRLEAYIRPVGNLGVFTLFPALALVFAGGLVGELIARAQRDARALLWRLAFAGGVMVPLGILLQVPDPTAASSPWIATGAVLGMRIGVMTLALACCGIVFGHRPMSSSNPLLVFGRTSLFVYWVHVELAYGIFSFPLRYALPLSWSLVGYVAMLALMYVSARLLLRYPVAKPLIPPHMKAGDALPLRGLPASGT